MLETVLIFVHTENSTFAPYVLVGGCLMNNLKWLEVSLKEWFCGFLSYVVSVMVITN